MDEKFKVSNVLVGLDLTEMDQHILRYTTMLCKVLSIENIYFLYVARDLELPDELLAEFPDLRHPVDEGLEDEIRAEVKSTCGELSAKTQVMVKEGHPMETVMKVSRIKEVDLIVLGRKKELKGSGILSSHIARNSECSLVLVPEKSVYDISNILVPVDFSDHSKIALNASMKIASETNAEVQCAHIYSVPTGYHTSGKSFEEFAEIMKGHAQRDFRKFAREMNVENEIDCVYLLHNDKKNQDLIHDYAAENGKDLIVLGSRGRTKAAVILIGSLAEKISISDYDIPLMIVKRKGENMGLFEALKRV